MTPETMPSIHDTHPTPAATSLGFAWLELTTRCQLACRHCYNSSGPDGSDGTMTLADWMSAIDQASELGTTMVQFIGGEPMLHPDLPALIRHALVAGVEVEVYSNLVHVPALLWPLLATRGVRLATSWYTDDAGQHQQITGRNTLERTRANIARALGMGIPLRAGIIDLGEGQRITQAEQVLRALGVTDYAVDRMRLLGRPARQACDASELCGRCGDGIAAILPDGSVTPCPLSRWLTAGSIHTSPLAELAGTAQQLAAEHITPALPHACRPPCEPQCTPGCDPSVNSPGGGDGCTPKLSCNPNQSCKPKNPCRPDTSCRPK